MNINAVIRAALKNRPLPSNPQQQKPQSPAPVGKNTAAPATGYTVRNPREPQVADALGRIPAPKRAGKFLQNAYASYNAAPDKKPPAAEVAYAMERFKATHKWARKSDPSQNRDLEFAVRYLLLKPKKSREYRLP